MSDRRTRTTCIQLVVPTNFKALSELTGIPAGTLAARYHRIKDKYPRHAVCMEALTVSHKTREHRGKYRGK